MTICYIKDINFENCECNHKHYKLCFSDLCNKDQKNKCFDIFKKYVKTAKFCKVNDTYFAGIRCFKKAQEAVNEINKNIF